MYFNFPFNRRLDLPALLLVRLIFITIIFGFSRWLFYIFNIQSFIHLNILELLQLMFYGIRFDLSAIAFVNLPVIFLMIIPFSFRFNQYYQKATNVLFVIVNALALVLNLIDVVFFRYIAKRTTSEVFDFLGNRNENTLLLMKQFFVDFWYMWIIFFVLIWLFIKITTFFVSRNTAPVRKFRWYFTQTLIFILFAASAVILARGGFQLKPISLITAAKYTESHNIPLLINTPFSVIKTFGSKQLIGKNYFEADKIEFIYSPEHKKNELNFFNDSTYSCKDHNVVILILESLGREYIGYYNTREKSLSPFLDSLLEKSITYQGYANGKRSIEALPSIFAGIPSLMNVDYPTSVYVNNSIKGIGSILKETGYQTAFFHGGNNGTMGFDVFAEMAGFDRYFGRSEYNNDDDFDQQWGIYDEPFLQFTAKKLNEMKQPFAAGVFTLSSHHPYSIPVKYKKDFPHAKNNMEETFAYLDHSLKRFFETASSFSWFKNTVFVITSDHTPEGSQNKNTDHYWNLYAVPLAFYIPGVQQGIKMDKIAQHIDILPSTIALLQSDKEVFSFGLNLFDTTQKSFAVNYMNGIYQFINNEYLLIQNEERPLEFYNILYDPQLKNNLVDKNVPEMKHQEKQLRAVIQQYNNRMIHNKLRVE
ncbi:MAG: hypothetical protein CVT92_05170 [Bacteroidetes bacterium HGW-Bacteroidetes-1]|jgi:phosphoglycerol transferase MdoB-like AlkP superfamily enzyme|nr:MAG: hypothetical protein CVT92_05170 [Bacteroidetes bacterium HGW-Bacteroidetes-1]